MKAVMEDIVEMDMVVVHILEMILQIVKYIQGYGGCYTAGYEVSSVGYDSSLYKVHRRSMKREYMGPRL